MPLDQIDLKILSELEQNSRLPVATLAQRVSLSRNAVRQRIERMERDQIITGYTIKRGDGKSNKNNVTAYMFISRHDRIRGADVTAAIKQIPEVKSCHIVSGDLDLILRIEASSQERIKEIWRTLADSPSILDINTSFSLSEII